jgi:hypothetical protein
MLSTSTPQQRRWRKSANRAPNPPAVPLANASEFDDWDYNYKLQHGRLISTNFYSGGRATIHPSPVITQIPTLVIPTPTTTTPIVRAHVIPSQAPDSGNQDISVRHDPEPALQNVDVRSDSEFLIGLQFKDRSVSAFDRESSTHELHQNELRLKIWREQVAQAAPVAMSPKSRRRRNTSELTTIEQVLRDIHITEHTADDSSTVASGTQGSEIKKEMSIDSRTDLESIRLCSEDGVDTFYFSRQIIALSKSFLKMMEQEGFDGEIILEEDTEALELLGSWMSRDLDFEITVCILPNLSDY